MILRRITQAFRKQDWFTVFVETVIVVMGVFLGLQVNNWNEARTDARLEAELRATLKSDFTELETMLSDRIDAILVLEEYVSELLDIVRADVAPTDKERMLLLLDAAWTLPRLPSPPTSYAEIIEAGRLSTLTDPELRRALSRYGQAVDLYEDAFPPTIESITSRDSMVVQSLRLSSDLEVARSNKAGIESYDWEILKNADADIQMVLVWHVAGEFLAKQQLEEVHNILKILETGTTE